MESIRNNLELSDRTSELIRTIEADGSLDKSAADGACFSLRQAIRESNMPNPNKWTLLDHLEDAAGQLAGSSHEPAAGELIDATSGLVF